jgi:hypothetical protein
MRIWGFVLTVMLAVCFAHIAAPAQEEEPGIDSAQFFAAKAAAGGKLDEALAWQAKDLVMQGVRAVQLAVERYAVDNPGGFYPQHINQVVIARLPGGKLSDLAGGPGYIAAGFYANPFTANTAEALDAVEVPFGWSDQHPGNFSYLQIYNEAGNVIGYVLLGYGPTRESGQDVDGDGQPDGVILSLASSSEPFPNGLVTFISDGRPVTIAMGE